MIRDSLKTALQPMDPASAGTVAIPESLSGLKDRDFAQRIATSVFGLTLDPTAPREGGSVEVVESMSFDVGSGPHEVAYLLVKAFRDDGSSYSYRTLACSHDYDFTLDERFTDENGEPIISGRSTRHSRSACPAKDLANRLKRKVIMASYYDEPKNVKFERLNPTRLPAILLDLLARQEAGEWIGVDSINGVYVQHVGEILELDFPEANRVVGLLEDEGKVWRSGNIIGLKSPAVPRSRPTRSWLTYEEEVRGDLLVSVEVFIPASNLEPQAVRIEASRWGVLHEIQQYHLQEPLTEKGEPSERDFTVLQQVLTSQVTRWRSPYANPYPVTLTPKTNLTPYVREARDGVGTEARTAGHWNLSVNDFGDWWCSACGNSSDSRKSPADVECVER